MLYKFPVCGLLTKDVFLSYFQGNIYQVHHKKLNLDWKKQVYKPLIQVYINL